MDEDGFRAPNVCRIVGISYRQLDYWARTGLVTPSVEPAHGSGTQRLYSFSDLVELRVIKQLLHAGVNLSKVRRALDVLRGQGEDLARITLLSDGRSIYACYSPEEVVDVLRRGQGVFGVAIGPVSEQVGGEVASLREASRRQARLSDREARRQSPWRADRATMVATRMHPAVKESPASSR